MYRTIDTTTWLDPKVRRLTPEGKLLFVYLFTNSHTHVCGLYYLPVLLISHETGIKESRLDTLLDTLSRVGLVSWDRVSEVVWVKKMFDRQGQGVKNDIAAARHLEGLHNCNLVKEFLRFYAHRNIPYRYPIDRVSSQEQEQKQEQKQEQDTPTPHESNRKRGTNGARVYSEPFKRFWGIYPSIRRGAKPVAWEAWQSAITRADAETIIAAATEFAASELGRCQFCPGPAPWLNQDRWEDDRSAWIRNHKPECEEIPF
jgi:hypothetical protein